MRFPVAVADANAATRQFTDVVLDQRRKARVEAAGWRTAGNSALRAKLTPSGRGKRPVIDTAPVDIYANDEPRSPEEKRRAMSWAQRLKRAKRNQATQLRTCDKGFGMMVEGVGWMIGGSSGVWPRSVIGQLCGK